MGGKSRTVRGREEVLRGNFSFNSEKLNTEMNRFLSFSDNYDSEFTECEAGKLSPESSHGR